MGYNRCRFARIYTVLGVLSCQLMGYNRCSIYSPWGAELSANGV